MKKWIPAILFLGFLGYDALGQNPDMEIERNLRRIDIPFEYANGFIVVKVTFNDVFPLRFIFDTGAEHTILSKREITDLLNIDYQRRFPIVGADLSKELYAYLAQGISLQLGGVKAVNRNILVLEEDYFHFEEYTGVNVQGILGSDFFRRFIVKINYPQGVISLYDPQYFDPPGKGFVSVPIEINRNKPYINAKINFHPDSSIQVRLLIDTGAGLALLLHTDTHPELKLPEKVIPSNLGAGLGGFLLGYMGRVQKLELEPFVFREVTSQFQDIPEGIDSSLFNQRNGIIGNEILRRFTIMIDYLHEQAYLEPNRHYKDEFIHDRSGLNLIAGGLNLNDFIIYGVIPGSPAAQAGLIRGDRILSINGIPAAFLDLEGANRKFRKRVGKKMCLKIARGNTKIHVSFHLRDLI
ncbi:MAG: aspartyl protease family protein [Phaeodactylibacter sp.]|nr:aspartyl protease family protein [Phaeodactylibacter sp.]MCB9301313.1 aspartyl protease family protein [Lewinellaceae bacterium]